MPDKFKGKDEGRVTQMDLRKGRDSRGKDRDFHELYYLEYFKNFGSKWTVNSGNKGAKQDQVYRFTLHWVEKTWEATQYKKDSSPSH